MTLCGFHVGPVDPFEYRPCDQEAPYLFQGSGLCGEHLALIQHRLVAAAQGPRLIQPSDGGVWLTPPPPGR